MIKAETLKESDGVEAIGICIDGDLEDVVAEVGAVVKHICLNAPSATEHVLAAMAYAAAEGSFIAEHGGDTDDIIGESDDLQ